MRTHPLYPCWAHRTQPAPPPSPFRVQSTHPRPAARHCRGVRPPSHWHRFALGGQRRWEDLQRHHTSYIGASYPPTPRRRTPPRCTTALSLASSRTRGRDDVGGRICNGTATSYIDASYINTTRELHIYLRPDFTFIPSIFLPIQIIAFVPDGATNQYKCPLTEARRGLIQPTRYKCLTFVPVGGSARYKCEANTSVPVRATDICTGLLLHPILICRHSCPRMFLSPTVFFLPFLFTLYGFPSSSFPHSCLFRYDSHLSLFFLQAFGSSRMKGPPRRGVGARPATREGATCGRRDAARALAEAGAVRVRNFIDFDSVAVAVFVDVVS
jgi:hypothetical protein